MASLRFLSLTLVSTASAIAAVGCGLEPVGDSGGESEIPASVQRAFNESCATSVGCHDTGSALVVLAAGESEAILSTNSATGDALVDFGNLDGSYLAQKVLKGSGIQGGVMPPSVQSENDDFNKAVIIGWIAGVEFAESGGESGDTGGDDMDTADSADSADTGEPECLIEAPVPEMPTFTADIWPILETRCATSGCHESFTPAMPDAAGAYLNLVGVDSSASMPFVDPMAPDNSYLWHKLVGTHKSVGGTGSTMPVVGSLCLIEAQAIYSWILADAEE